MSGLPSDPGKRVPCSWLHSLQGPALVLFWSLLKSLWIQGNMLTWTLSTHLQTAFWVPGIQNSQSKQPHLLEHLLVHPMVPSVECSQAQCVAKGWAVYFVFCLLFCLYFSISSFFIKFKLFFLPGRIQEVIVCIPFPCTSISSFPFSSSSSSISFPFTSPCRTNILYSCS